MPRIVPRTREVALLAAAAALSACNVDFSLVRNCPLTSYNRGEQYLLDYELEIPANCPVPEGQQNEIKRAGAFVYDYGYSDFAYGHAVIKNANGSTVQAAIDFFFHESTDRNGNQVDRYTAFPQAYYPASSAGYLSNDFGYFIASNSSFAEGNPGDPYGRVTITYESSNIHVAVNGNAIPLSNQSATYSASVSGGVTPYSYAWYRDGSYTGAGSSYTGSGTRDFILRTEVTDAAMATRAAVFAVDVDGVTVAVSGPTLVYASQGGGTWTASGQGGYLPYTFRWYLDGEYTGDGDTFDGYPGEGHHSLRAELQDAHGTLGSATFFVTGIGNESCEPTPPAITCDP